MYSTPWTLLVECGKCPEPPLGGALHGRLLVKPWSLENFRTLYRGYTYSMDACWRSLENVLPVNVSVPSLLCLWAALFRYLEIILPPCSSSPTVSPFPISPLLDIYSRQTWRKDHLISPRPVVPGNRYPPRLYSLHCIKGQMDRKQKDKTSSLPPLLLLY
jgi:hypothetical protein